VGTAAEFISVARGRAHLTQDELARLASTSRPTVSAYESGTKDPRVDTLDRLLEATGHRLVTRIRPTWTVVGSGRKSAYVPSALPDLSNDEALAEVTLGIHLAWSGQRRFRLVDRHDRQRAYEIVLREGAPDDIERYVDGALLVDAWNDLFLPRWIRTGWQPLIDQYLHA
jgi:transcriptional regulator with XRE-family HTH domain